MTSSILAYLIRDRYIFGLCNNRNREFGARAKSHVIVSAL